MGDRAVHECKKKLRIGYLIPEFPGQTHIWMWREIVWMQRWAELVHVYSTRAPPERDRARHDFAETSRTMTTLLWPAPVLGSVLWALARRPQGVLAAAKLCFTLPVAARPAFVHVLKLLPSACYLSKAATEQRLTHLHCHSCANAAVLAMMTKRIAGIPFSLTLNANIDWWGGAMREKFSDADFTLAITDWLLEQIHQDYPELGPDQALIGRIGVDTTVWTERGPVSGKEPYFRIVTVGRLHASKGHDTLIRAVERLVARGRMVRLTLVGDGPERAALEEQVRAANLSDAVTFTGSLSEHKVREELVKADAFVLASHAEPLGVVYMEAMALGVPAIGTNAGGVGEIITDGQDGLLVGPRDHEALAAAIERLIDDPSLAQTLGARGRQTIVERFDSRIGAATLYARITGEEPPVPAASGTAGH